MSKHEGNDGEGVRPAPPQETGRAGERPAHEAGHPGPAAEAGDEPHPRSYDHAMDLVDRLREQLAAKTAEVADLKDRLLREHADLENFKRRMQRERHDALRYASEHLLRDLLPVIDNLQRAVDAAGTAGDTNLQSRVDGLVTGVKMVLHQFTETLGRFGVTRVESAGQSFDPSHHEAVAHVETHEQAPGSVVDEYESGYRLHDRLLRPAKVTVAKPKG